MRRLALGAALVAACASTPQPAPDQVTVMWNRVDDVQATCNKLAGRKEVFALRGCAKWSDNDRSGSRVCSIYAPAPKSETDVQAFATLGHELLHCFDGKWHDRWGHMHEPERQAAAGGSRKPASASRAD